VAAGEFSVKVNGKSFAVTSTPSSYAELRRPWRDGDRVEVELPMQTTVERLPDGSDWVAILRGPIVLASPAGTNDLRGLYADDGRMGQVAGGPLVPMEQAPVLLASASDVPRHIKPDFAAGPLHFRLTDVVEPPLSGGLPLIPFFRLHDARYQMYWQLTTKEQLAARKEQLAVAERAKALRDANTLDRVAPGEQQSEVEHELAGEGIEAGMFQGRRWRHGRSFQYTLDTRGEKAMDLAVTYWGGDRDRNFDVLANGKLLATERLDGSRQSQFFEKRYPFPADVIATTTNGRITIKFTAPSGLAGGVFDVRLMKPEPSSNAPAPH
jgi:hypothetical protein